MKIFILTLTLKIESVTIFKVLLSIPCYFGGCFNMSYEKVAQAKKVIIGTKQTAKAIKNNRALEVFVASDADSRVVEAVIQEAKQSNVPITYVSSMKKLGKACGIDVGAAAVAIVNE
jgi:large subunit ribosomal protein L7A